VLPGCGTTGPADETLQIPARPARLVPARQH
jgi:hypothetical protein